MLRAEANHAFSSCYTLYGADVAVGELRMSWFNEKAEAVIDDRQLELYREGTFSGPFILASDGIEIARAVKPSVWKNRFEITFGSVTCELAKTAVLRSAFELRLEESTVGTIKRESIWKRTARANLPDEWPNALKVFILWLVLIIWQREAAAVSG